jgi:hypothetical protein
VKPARLLPLVAMILFAVSTTYADGADAHVVMGGGGPGSPTCTQFVGTSTTGSVSGDCTVAPNTLATTIGFAAPDIDTNGGLSCSDPGLQSIGWTAATSTFLGSGGTIDVCSFTAPTVITMADYDAAITADGQHPTQFGFAHLLGINDGDCDLDDFLFGIPGANEGGNGAMGCDITFSTTQGQGFAANTTFGVAPGNTAGDFAVFATPEPESFSLILLGLSCLPFMRRKLVRN